MIGGNKSFQVTEDGGGSEEGREAHSSPHNNKMDSISFLYLHLQRHLKNHFAHLSTHHFAYHHLVVGSLLDAGIQR